MSKALISIMHMLHILRMRLLKLLNLMLCMIVVVRLVGDLRLPVQEIDVARCRNIQLFVLSGLILFDFLKVIGILYALICHGQRIHQRIVICQIELVLRISWLILLNLVCFTLRYRFLNLSFLLMA